MEYESPQHFLLPFFDITDLNRSYERILAFHMERREQIIVKLQENNVPFEKLDPSGLAVDMDLVPDGVDIKELLKGNNELMKALYDDLRIETVK